MLPSLDPAETGALVEAAARAHAHAYAPYSKFHVGAAVSAGGRIFTGCNIENASYGLTICAERSAVFSAVAAGERTIEAIAIFTDTSEPVTPCGACRQVLREFGRDIRIVSATPGGAQREYLLFDLLPDAFGPEHL